ncbi:hypothetical protein MM50RIKEN_16640 [Vescimonas coprocola]|uniref:Secreted protein n=1 Tax=Vescimonas coprocola TaxID=2714355 RepID=A0A810Q8S1_9FIRM|nr:hypothetical protein MM50RIKEN_16640 [Vescimonas coprocola]
MVMTLRAVPSALKYASVPAASVATQMASTDSNNSFRFMWLLLSCLWSASIGRTEKVVDRSGQTGAAAVTAALVWPGL